MSRESFDPSFISSYHPFYLSIAGIKLINSEALYDEQKRMFGNSDGTFRDVEYEEVKNMPVMDSCIREALRLVSCSLFSRQILGIIQVSPTRLLDPPSLYYPIS